VVALTRYNRKMERDFQRGTLRLLFHVSKYWPCSSLGAEAANCLCVSKDDMSMLRQNGFPESVSISPDAQKNKAKTASSKRCTGNHLTFLMHSCEYIHQKTLMKTSIMCVKDTFSRNYTPNTDMYIHILCIFKTIRIHIP